MTEPHPWRRMHTPDETTRAAANRTVNALCALADAVAPTYSAECADALNTNRAPITDAERWAAELHALAYAVNHAFTDPSQACTSYDNARRGYADNLPK